jgi:hypothetical protein
MGRIQRDANGQVTSDFREGVGDKPCSVCGGRAHAYYFGPSEIWICAECAVETLPALIADAIVGCYTVNGRDLHHFEDRIRLAFWRGMALASRPTAGRQAVAP